METLHGGLYRVLQELGRGANGRVLLAKDSNLGKYWAIKEMPKSKNENFISEARILLSFNHPGIVRIVSIFEENEKLYLVMDYIRGSNLKEIQKQNGNFTEDQVRKWGIELCDILRYMHSMDPPVIYRDLKPSNIILQENGHLILVDFGTAGALDTENEHVGTKGFASPEQYDISGKTDVRSDIYGLGCCLYYLLTGRPVKKDLPKEAIRRNRRDKNAEDNSFPEISSGMAAVIVTCIAQDPNERYQSISEVCDALKTYSQCQCRKEKHRQRQKIAGGVLIITGLLAAGTGIWIRQHAKQIRNEKYAAFLEKADKEPRDQKKSELLIQAMELCPERTDAYMAYITFVREDGIFTAKEAEVLQDHLVSAGDILTMQKEYPVLSLKAGECYLLDPAEEDTKADQDDRYTESLRWFQTAYVSLSELSIENQTLLSEYKGLAEFLTNTDNTQGRYARCYFHLNKLCREIDAIRYEEPMHCRNLGALAVKVLTIYRSEMICDGITDSEIRILREKAQEIAEKS